MTKIRILIADDHVVLRSGLRRLLNEYADIEVIGEANDCDEAIARAGELVPDVLLLDITMPGSGGIDVIRIVKANYPDIHILILTMHEDESHFIASIKAGASGYVPKKAADSELIAAIRAVNRGEKYIYSSFAKSMISRMIDGEMPNKAAAVDSYEQLSQREQEVLKLVAQGYTNQQVAEQLYLSIKTVETYKSRLMEKLSLHSRAELVRFALQRGLLVQ